jgi:hypothetical protein
MKYLRLMLGIGSAFVVSGGLALTLDGCTVAPDTYIAECDPDPLFPSKLCPGDAGTDGDADGEAGPDGPGIKPQSCSGRCAPFPDGTSAGFWSREPLLVWAGPGAEVPEGGCPAGLAMQFDRYADLVAPPLVCDICGCEPSEGTCSGVPEQIEIRAGSCDDPGAATLPFGGPPAWDGACTDANALPAGAMCPAGSSTPCAQYVTASVLPPPAAEKCAVTVNPVPAFGNFVGWATRVLACRGTAVEGVCGDGGGAVCVSDLPLPWHQCVWRAGLHDECPAPYTSDRFFTYSLTGYTDKRECTPCECGAPEGSACEGALRLYGDAACGSEFDSSALSSLDGQCVKVVPPGRAIGGKAITDHSYVPGTCVASGGEPTGEAEANETDAVTFCCLPPFDAVE